MRFFRLKRQLNLIPKNFIEESFLFFGRSSAFVNQVCEHIRKIGRTQKVSFLFLQNLKKVSKKGIVDKKRYNVVILVYLQLKIYIQ